MSLLLFIQYLLYVLNLTSNTAPTPFPPAFANYPKNDDPSDKSIKFATPWFFHYPAFQDLRIAYLLGVGVDKD
jgi:hypothetical protein